MNWIQKGYRDSAMKKMSEIILEMATTLLKHPDAFPSTEAAHAALLFAHIAWNKAIGIKITDKGYRNVLKEFKTSNPKLWDEFKLTNHKEIIESLISFKNDHYPEDSRVIQVCGMRGVNVHVEWSGPEK